MPSFPLTVLRQMSNSSKKTALGKRSFNDTKVKRKTEKSRNQRHIRGRTLKPN